MSAGSVRCVDIVLIEDKLFIHRHDEAMSRIMGRGEMPDRLAQNLILFRQNNGTLSNRRREKEFSALTDDEVRSLENIIQNVFEGFDVTGLKLSERGEVK
jgi:hypothetical protein